VTSVLRLEARRNITPLLLPVMALLLWFSPYGRSLGDLALWARRSSALQESLLGIAPFMAGVAAWTASRDGRGQTLDLLATTPRGSWRRGLYGWAATTLWGLLFYALAAALLFGLTAREATWGGPSWWAVAVGAVTIVTFSAAGHALGVLFPGRFVAPLTAVGSFLAIVVGAVVKTQNNPYGLVTPVGTSIDPDRAMFYKTGPAEDIVQLLFLTGVTAVAIGVLALPAAAGGRWVRRTGTALTAAGIATAMAALWLAGGAKVNVNEGRIFIPHLQSTPADQEISYTPVCDRSPIPACVHPAYRRTLGQVAAALRPVTVQLAGLPGAPQRIDLRLNGPSTPVGGAPPVLYLEPPLDAADAGEPIRGGDAQQLRSFLVTDVVTAPGSEPTAAQQAVMLGVLAVAGDPMDTAVLPTRGEPDASVTAAARRFAAAPAAERRQWLGAHLGALRAGRLTLKDLP